MKILLVWPGHAFSTSDVATGYEKALCDLGHTVKSFNYHSAIVFYTRALDSNYDERRRGGIPFDSETAMLLASEHVVIDVIDFIPDVVLIVNGFRLHRRAYELMYQLDVPLALLCTESPYQDQEQSLILSKGHISLAFVNDKHSVAPLQSLTGVKCVYLPHSYDPTVHYPDRVGTYFHSDVFFQGTLFPERKELFNNLSYLIGNGTNVHIGGIEIEIDLIDEDDLLSNDEVVKRYRGTKIALNPHREFIGIDCNGKRLTIAPGSAYSLGPRAYEIAACKTFQICDNTRQELTDVFGEAVVTYNDKTDLVSKIHHYLHHPAQRKELAQLAWERVQGCSFKSRAETIIVPNLEELTGG